MTSEEMVPLTPRTTLEILVFTVGGVHCGIDGELVGRIITLDEAEARKVKFRWFHQLLPFGGDEVDYLRPRVVILKEGGSETGLVIDQPRDIIEVRVGSIRPLPSLLGTGKGGRVFWGGLVLDEKVVLLVDPGRLPR